MEQLTEFIKDNPTLSRLVGGLVIAAAGIVAYRIVNSRDSQARSNYPQDTVILHQVGRGPYAPSMTPFAVKLETYLRMAKIPYQNVHDMKRSSKGKFPWMEYNGQSVADSTFCITFLNNTRGIDLNGQLTPAQRGCALAFQRLVEDSLYWALAMQRWVHELDVDFIKTSFNMPHATLFARFLISPKVRKAAWGQGIGRHSREEVLEIARRDLQAIADFMGQKKFLMGDEPSETDCAVFGMLSQMYWHAPTQTIGGMFSEQFPSLGAYCERMKTTFWPDWNDCITHGNTRKATK